MPSTTTTRDWFLWTLSIVYLLAFISLFVQLPGLIGKKGILPAFLVLQKESESVEEFVLNKPSILSLLPKIGLDLDLGLDFLCIGGIVTSFASFISRDHRNALVMALQWFFYLSLVQVGQIFLASKWDNLLLEVGFVAILLAPVGLFGLNDSKSTVVVSQDSQSKSPLKFKFLKMTENYRLPLWYVKWTLARLVVSDASSALSSVFDGEGGVFLFADDSKPFKHLLTSVENQILPTPFSWFIGCLPSCLVAMVTATHLISHLPVALCILSPWKPTRLAAFYWLLATSVTTGLLGNQGFYPLLITTLAITLVDDEWFNSTRHCLTGRGSSPIISDSPQMPQPPSGNLPQSACLSPPYNSATISKLLKIAGLVVVVYALALVYAVPHLIVITQNISSLVIQAFLALLKAMYLLDSVSTTLVAVLAGCLLLSQVSCALQRQRMTIGCAFPKRIIIHARFAILFTTTIGLFVCSLVPLVWHTDNSTGESVAPAPLQTAYLWAHKHYHIVNNYASNHHNGFVGEEGREEIVIEGSLDKKEWREYHLLFKPSHPSKTPQIIAAHHPRLDECLWHASRSNYKQHNWILNLAYRLLTQQQEVVDLLDGNPFENDPPNFIRADLYSYHFNYNLNETSDWWTREWAGHYTPVLSLADPSFVKYVSKSGITEQSEEDEEEMRMAGCHGNNILASGLSFVRSSLGQTSGSVMCIFLVLLGLLLSMVDPSRTTKYHVTMATDHNGGVMTNGVMTNGVTTNGVMTNGMMTNGVMTNGVGGKVGRGRHGSIINVPVEILK